MSVSFRCGDHGALVAYLYEECDDATRAAVASHLARCGACAREVSALGATRARLMDWTSPPVSFGFRVGSQPGGESGVRSRLFGVDSAALEPAPPRAVPWWRQPLPAWAQAAAAAAIFAAGWSIGTARGDAVEPLPRQPGAAQAAVTRDDLARVEQRVRDELTAIRSTPSAPRIDERALMKRVQAMVAESEERQRRELALRTVQVMRDLDLQHRADLAQVQRSMGVLQGTIGAEVRQQRDGINYLIRASQTGR